MDGSSIDLLAVADLHDIDERCCIVYGVDDAIPTLTDAVSVPLGCKLFAAARAWLVREGRDPSCDPLPFSLGGNGLKFLDRGRPDLDAISSHAVSAA